MTSSTVARLHALMDACGQDQPYAEPMLSAVRKAAYALTDQEFGKIWDEFKRMKSGMYNDADMEQTLKSYVAQVRTSGVPDRAYQLYDDTIYVMCVGFDYNYRFTGFSCAVYLCLAKLEEHAQQQQHGPQPRPKPRDEPVPMPAPLASSLPPLSASLPPIKDSAAAAPPPQSTAGEPTPSLAEQVTQTEKEKAALEEAKKQDAATLAVAAQERLRALIEACGMASDYKEPTVSVVRNAAYALTDAEFADVWNEFKVHASPLNKERIIEASLQARVACTGANLTREQLRNVYVFEMCCVHHHGHMLYWLRQAAVRCLTKLEQSVVHGPQLLDDKAAAPAAPLASSLPPLSAAAAPPPSTAGELTAALPMSLSEQVAQMEKDNAALRTQVEEADAVLRDRLHDISVRWERTVKEQREKLTYEKRDLEEHNRGVTSKLADQAFVLRKKYDECKRAKVALQRDVDDMQVRLAQAKAGTKEPRDLLVSGMAETLKKWNDELWVQRNEHALEKEALSAQLTESKAAHQSAAQQLAQACADNTELRHKLAKADELYKQAVHLDENSRTEAGKLYTMLAESKAALQKNDTDWQRTDMKNRAKMAHMKKEITDWQKKIEEDKAAQQQHEHELIAQAKADKENWIAESDEKWGAAQQKMIKGHALEKEALLARIGAAMTEANADKQEMRDLRANFITEHTKWSAELEKQRAEHALAIERVVAFHDKRLNDELEKQKSETAAMHERLILTTAEWVKWQDDAAKTQRDKDAKIAELEKERAEHARQKEALERDLKDKCAQADAKITGLQKKLAETVVERKQAIDLCAAREFANNELRADLGRANAACTHAAELATGKYNHWYQEHGVMKEQLEQANAQVQRLTKMVEGKDTEIANLIDKIRHSETEVAYLNVKLVEAGAELKQAIATHQKVIDDKDAEITKANTINADLVDQVRAARQDNKGAELEKYRVEHAALQTENAYLREQLARHTTSLKEADALTKQLTNDKDAEIAKVADLQKKLAETVVERTQATDLCAAREVTNNELRADLEQITKHRDALKAENAFLSDDLAEAAATHQKVIEDKNAELTNTHATLSELADELKRSTAVHTVLHEKKDADLAALRLMIAEKNKQIVEAENIARRLEGTLADLRAGKDKQIAELRAALNECKVHLLVAQTQPRDDAVRLRAEVDQKETEVKKMTATNSDLEISVAFLRDRLAEAEDALKKGTAAHKQACDNKDARIVELRNKLMDAEAAAESQCKRADFKMAECGDLYTMMDGLRRETADLRKKLAEAEKFSRTLMDNDEQAQRANMDCMARQNEAINDAKNQARVAERETAELRQKLAEAEDALKKGPAAHIAELQAQLAQAHEEGEHLHYESTAHLAQYNDTKYALRQQLAENEKLRALVGKSNTEWQDVVKKLQARLDEQDDVVQLAAKVLGAHVKDRSAALEEVD